MTLHAYTAVINGLETMLYLHEDEPAARGLALADEPDPVPSKRRGAPANKSASKTTKQADSASVDTETSQGQDNVPDRGF